MTDKPIGELLAGTCKIAKMDELRYECKDIYKNGLPPGISTGWFHFDYYFKVLRSQLNVITGFPGSGKSEWLESMQMNLAKNEGWNIFSFAPECDPLSFQITKMVKKYWERTDFSDEEFEVAMDFIEKHFDYVDASIDDYNLDEILKTIEDRPRLSGKKYDMAVIDPWNELESHCPKGVTETDYIGNSLKKIRKFARKNDLSFWVVAHPTKLQNKDGSTPKLSLYSIHGSAHWYNKTDNGFIIHRSLEAGADHIVKVEIKKIKKGFYGKLGEQTFEFNSQIGCYNDIYTNYTQPSPKTF